jgi:hypothetical protein
MIAKDTLKYIYYSLNFLVIVSNFEGATQSERSLCKNMLPGCRTKRGGMETVLLR